MSDDNDQEPISVPAPETTPEDEEKAKQDNERDEKINAIQANVRREAEYLHQEVRVNTEQLLNFKDDDQHLEQSKKDWDEIVSKISAYIPVANQAGQDLVAAGCTEDAAIVRGCQLSSHHASEALAAAQKAQAADVSTYAYIEIEPVRNSIDAMLSTLNG